MTHTIVISHMGRPLLTNAAHRMHHHQVAKIRKQYREGTCTLARAHRIPHYDAVTITARAEYPTSRSLPDADATAPSVKGVIDGLVDAGIIDDDGPAHLHAVTYEAPRVVTGCTPALVITITPTPQDGQREGAGS